MVRRYTDSEYTFDAALKTVTLTGVNPVELGGFALVVNVTDGIIIFNPRDPTKTGTVTGASGVLTLTFDTTGMANGDDLLVVYDDLTLTPNTTGLATQATLASVLTAVQLIDNMISGARGLVTEDNSAAILAKLLASIAVTGSVTANAGTNLNTSALALEATLQSVKTAVEVLDNFISGARGLVTEDNSAAIKTALELIDNAISGSEMQVDVVTDPPLLAATDSVAIYGSDDGGTTKRIIKTDAGGAIQVDMETSALALEATLQSVKTAVEVIDNFISGARGLVTEDNSAAILAALAGTLTISGTVTANAGTNLNTSALALEATLQSVKTAVELLDNAIAGTELQVDIVAPLPAGANNIGDVDVLTIPGIVGTIADDATTPGSPVMVGGWMKNFDGSDPGNVSTEDDAVRFITDPNRRQYVNDVHPQYWSYHEDSSNALTDAEVKAAPASGYAIFVTDIVFSTGAVIACNIFFEEGAAKKLGPYYLEAVNGRGLHIQFKTPKQITAATALTVTTSAAIAHSIDITGFIAKV